MDLTDALTAALTPDRRRPIPGAAPILAAVTARHLVEVLLAEGYVLMKRPDAPAPSSTPHMRDEG